MQVRMTQVYIFKTDDRRFTLTNEAEIGTVNPSSSNQLPPQNRPLTRPKEKGLKRQIIVSFILALTGAITLALIIYFAGRARGSWS